MYGFDYSAIKPQAILEPLVDVVEPSQMMSDMERVIEFDINTVKKEELVFFYFIKKSFVLFYFVDFPLYFVLVEFFFFLKKKHTSLH